MDLGLVGSGPAAESIAAAWEDVDGRVVRFSPEELTADESIPRIGAVVAPSGATVFEKADTIFSRYVAVEIGGIGGVPRSELDASVATIVSEEGCYRCLEARVRSNVDGEPDATSPTGDRSAVRFGGATAANELLSALRERTPWRTITEIPGRTREFLPVPGCEHCGGTTDDSTRNRPLVKGGSFELSHRSVGLEDALSRAERSVDDRVGLLSEVGERESFPVPYYISMTADTTVFGDAQAAEFAAGVDVDWDRAFMKALGEGLERYCAGVYRSSSLHTAPAESLPEAVPPSEFVLPDDRERSDSGTQIEWIEGIELGTERRAYLPAEFVLYPPPTRRHKPAITTGLGLGNSTVEATLSGLYEVIERDATMIGWYSTFEPLKLVVEDPIVETLEKRARAESLTVTPLFLTQDVDVPAVAVAVHREESAIDGDPWPAFAMGSGASLDVVSAIRSALSEALQNWMELDAMGETAAQKEKAAIGRYGRFPTEARSFVDVETSIDAATVSVADLDGRAELDTVLDRLDAAGLSAYAVRTTTRDVESLGFEAVRVLIPEAQPLFTGEPFFGERAETVPRSLGFEPRLDRSYHPYP